MNLQQLKSQFTLGHIALVVAAVALLGGLTMVQNWSAVKAAFKSSVASSEEGSGLYYAYQAPNEPTVLGSDTIPDGPAVINEDGTISTLDSFGSVLGQNSEVNINIDDIKVNTISGNPENLRLYLDESFVIESAILPGELEVALVSSDRGQTQAQITKLRSVQNQLLAMNVPSMAERLHKLKVAQYHSAITLLENYFHADENPEYVTQILMEFMEMQKQQDAENLKFFKDYPEL